MLHKISIITALCFFCYNTYAQVGAVWNSATSGTLNGVPFTVTGFQGGHLFSSDLSGGDFAAAPLGSNQSILVYSHKSDWTVTFDSPIKNLRLYINDWRMEAIANSSGTLTLNGTKLSGSNFTVTGTEIDVSSSFANGIVEFAGNTTSLSYNVDGIMTASIALTFGLASNYSSVPTLSEWGLLNLALLLMICGTLYLLQPNLKQG